MRRGVAADVVERARGFLRRPGISVVPEARAACGAARVHAMHDPDRGWPRHRVLGAGAGRRRGTSRRSRARARSCPRAGGFCEAFGLDPLGTIASGSLLDDGGCPTTRTTVTEACRAAGIDCAAIGRVTRGFGRRGARLRRSPAPHAHVSAGRDHSNLWRLLVPQVGYAHRQAPMGRERHGRHLSPARLAGRRRDCSSPAAT